MSGRISAQAKPRSACRRCAFVRLWGLEAQRGRYPPNQKGRKVSKKYAGRRMCSCLSTVRGSIKRTRYGKRLPSTNRSLAAPRRTDGIRAFPPSNTTSPCTASHWTRRPNGPFDGVFLRLFTPFFSDSVWPQVSLIPALPFAAEHRQIRPLLHRSLLRPAVPPRSSLSTPLILLAPPQIAKLDHRRIPIVHAAPLICFSAATGSCFSPTPLTSARRFAFLSSLRHDPKHQIIAFPPNRLAAPFFAPPQAAKPDPPSSPAKARSDRIAISAIGSFILAAAATRIVFSFASATSVFHSPSTLIQCSTFPAPSRCGSQISQTGSLPFKPVRLLHAPLAAHPAIAVSAPCFLCSSRQPSAALPSTTFL